MANLLNESTARTSPHPPRRRRPWVKALAAVAAVAVAVPFGAQLAGALPNWGSPLEQRIVDRSPAPLMTALADLSQYRAATGTFQVLVDLERDTPHVPAVISGERTTYFATGHADAVVDFSGLGAERVTVSEDRRSVAILLPAPVVTPAVVDPEESRVVGRDRGVVERLAGAVQDNPTNDQDLYRLAGEKLDAAAQASDLAGRAEENTRTMLTTLAGSLGYEQVTVTFEDPR